MNETVDHIVSTIHVPAHSTMAETRSRVVGEDGALTWLGTVLKTEHLRWCGPCREEVTP